MGKTPSEKKDFGYQGGVTDGYNISEENTGIRI